MNSRNIIILWFLLTGSLAARAQDCQMDVKTEIVSPSDGLNNGSISFQVGGQSGSKDYAIFNITANQKKENVKSSYKFNDLEAGIYEFIVIDRRKTKCAKEIQIKIEKQ